MKAIIYYIIWIVISLGICIYSAINCEKYNALIPVAFGTICILLIASLIIIIKEKNIKENFRSISFSRT